MATNYVTASYQEVYDLSNQSGQVSVLGIRTPSPGVPYKMLRGFFSQFRKFRYYGCEVRVQPASMLPADPLQIGLEAGETIDPRDMLNPILFHGCHGDDLNYALNMIYQGGQYTPVPNSSIDEMDVELGDSFYRGAAYGNVDMEDVYYSCLSDVGWKKFGVQQPFRLRLRPLVHQVVMNKVFTPTDPVNGRSRGQLEIDDSTGDFDIRGSSYEYVGVTQGDEVSAVRSLPQMFTNRLTSMGWLDCRRSMISSSSNISTENYVSIPKTFMGIILLPPSYRQEMYMRIVIVHRFGFKDFTTSLNWDVQNQVFENLPDSATAEASMFDSPSLESPSASIVQTTAGVF